MLKWHVYVTSECSVLTLTPLAVHTSIHRTPGQRSIRTDEAGSRGATADRAIPVQTEETYGEIAVTVVTAAVTSILSRRC